MGNKYPKKDPVDLAITGDEDAIEEVLVSVHAPLFDLALHLDAEQARAATIAALSALAAELRAERRPEPEALAFCVKLLLMQLGAVSPSLAALAAIEDPVDRRILVARLTTDLDPEALAPAFALSADAITDRERAALALAGIDADEVREALDAVSIETPLPPDIVDAALESPADD